MEQAWQALVAGRLAQGKSPRDGLPALVRQLRRRTEEAGLGGGLLFDGERVVMLFEGALPAVALLLETLAAAPQLDGAPQPLVECPPAAAPAGPMRWIAGYAEPELIDALCEADAAAQAQAFKQALQACGAL